MSKFFTRKNLAPYIANLFAGIGVGCAVGAAICTFTAVEIIAAKYDVNYNRAVTCIFVMGGSAAGALGGFAGYWASGASIASEGSTEGVIIKDMGFEYKIDFNLFEKIV